MTQELPSQPAIGERLGSGKEAEVFAFGEDVLKLYRHPAAQATAFHEAAILAAGSEAARASSCLAPAARASPPQ